MSKKHNLERAEAQSLMEIKPRPPPGGYAYERVVQCDLRCPVQFKQKNNAKRHFASDPAKLTKRHKNRGHAMTEAEIAAELATARWPTSTQDGRGTGSTHHEWTPPIACPRECMCTFKNWNEAFSHVSLAHRNDETTPIDARIADSRAESDRLYPTTPRPNVQVVLTDADALDEADGDL